MFDTHTHIQFKIFEDPIDEVVDKARVAGVSRIVAVGTDLESSKKAIDLAKQFNGVYASVGIHPHHVFEHFHSQENLQKDLIQIEDLIYMEKVLAIGETGIDRHEYTTTKYKDYRVNPEFIALQKVLFTQQIKLAIKYQKSLIVHNRKAVDETLAVLKGNWSEALAERSVFHCCEPEQKLLDFAKEYNIFIGVDGDVTYDKKKQKFVKQIPLELLVLETDSPFLVPKGVTFPNMPANLKIIAAKIAEIKKVEQKKIQEITFQNSLKLFGIIS